MEHCPLCQGTVQRDPEHPGVSRCLSCWTAWTAPREKRCPGHRPTLNAALRKLAESTELNR